jgi:predicted Rossmann fold nucleotide-binding protein DprA/Smf involved in DNA uptake
VGDGQNGDAGPVDRARSGVTASSTARSLSGRLLELLVVGDPTTAEALSRHSGQSVERVLAALLDLEIEGRVGRLAGSRFVKRASPWARL